MTGLGNSVGARRALGWSMLVGNLVMLLVFVGAAGATSQALRAIERSTVHACGQRAADEVGVAFLSTGAARFVDDDTISFRATDPDGGTLAVTCRLAEPDPDTEGPLGVLAVEAAP